MKRIINTVLKSDNTLEIYMGDRLLVEVKDGKDDEDFIEDVLYSLGYDWMHDGTIRKRINIEPSITKESIYDEMCKLLTDYEHPEDYEGYDDIEWESEFYGMLVKIQNNWETVITVQND